MADILRRRAYADERNWNWGLYFAKDDDRIFVPKQVGAFSDANAVVVVRARRTWLIRNALASLSDPFAGAVDGLDNKLWPPVRPAGAARADRWFEPAWLCVQR